MVAETAAEMITIGKPNGCSRFGPVISRARSDGLRTLIQAGRVSANGEGGDPAALSCGYEVSGGERERGHIGVRERPEAEAILGHGPWRLV